MGNFFTSLFSSGSSSKQEDEGAAKAKNEEKNFVFQVCGKDTYIYNGGTPEMVHKAISEVSSLVSLRIGDLVAIELQSPTPLCSRSDERISIRGEFLGNETFSTEIIF